MRLTLVLTAVLAGAATAAGCGDEADPVSGADAPVVTSPGTTIPYEAGGADGSGGDGRSGDAQRGGVAAGPDAGSGG